MSFKFSLPSGLPEFGSFAVGGPSGTGKTHLSGTVGPDAKMLMFDSEGGSITFSTKAFKAAKDAGTNENLHIIKFPRDATPAALLHTVESVLDQLISSNNKEGYELIVLDSLTELQAQVIGAFAGKDPRQAYGLWADGLHRIITKARRLDAHSLFIARLRATFDEVLGREIVRYDISPGAWSTVSGLFDAIGFMDLRTQGVKTVRTLTFEPTMRFPAKERFGLKEMVEPTMRQILDAVASARADEPVSPVGPRAAAAGRQRA